MLDPRERQEMEEVLLHYGVKGMRWGVRRALRKQGYTRKEVRKKNKEYKKETEFNQLSGNLSIASRMAAINRKEKGIQAFPSPETGYQVRRKTKLERVFGGSSKKKIEKALGIDLKEVTPYQRRTAKKIVSKFDGVVVRVSTPDNIDAPFADWKRIN